MNDQILGLMALAFNPSNQEAGNFCEFEARQPLYNKFQTKPWEPSKKQTNKKRTNDMARLMIC